MEEEKETNENEGENENEFDEKDDNLKETSVVGFDDEILTREVPKKSIFKKIFRGAGYGSLIVGGGILYILFNILQFVVPAIVGLSMIWWAIVEFLRGSIIVGLLVLLIGTPIAIGIANWVSIPLFFLAILAVIIWGIIHLFGFSVSFGNVWDVIWLVIKTLLLGGMAFLGINEFIKAIKEKRIVNFFKKNWFYILLFFFLLWLFFPRGFFYHKIEFTPEEKEQAGYFRELIKKKDMALEIIEEASKESLEPTFSLTLEQSEKYNQYLKEAYGYCDRIDDATLEKIHPDLPYHFRNELCQHLQLDIETLELTKGGEEINPDVIEKQIEVFGLSGKFIDWYNSNRNKFDIP